MKKHYKMTYQISPFGEEIVWWDIGFQKWITENERQQKKHSDNLISDAFCHTKSKAVKILNQLIAISAKGTEIHVTKRSPELRRKHKYFVFKFIVL